MPRLDLGSPEEHQYFGEDISLKEITTSGPYGVHDTLRYGLHSVSHDLAPRHPLQGQLANLPDLEESRRSKLGRQLGLHLPLRMGMEKKLVDSRRLGGLPSSNLGLSILLGTDETLDVSEILNDSNMTPHLSQLPDLM